MADRYDLPGMMDLLCMRAREELADGGKIAEMLIAASRHKCKELKRIAIEKLRARRDLLDQEDFRRKFNGDQNVLFDLIQDMYDAMDE